MKCCFCQVRGRKAYRPVPTPDGPHDMMCCLCDTTDWGIRGNWSKPKQESEVRAKQDEVRKVPRKKGRAGKKAPRKEAKPAGRTRPGAVPRGKGSVR